MNLSSETVVGMSNRKPYPSDVSDKEWSFVALIWRSFEKMRPNETTSCAKYSTD